MLYQFRLPHFASFVHNIGPDKLNPERWYTLNKLYKRAILRGLTALGCSTVLCSAGVQAAETILYTNNFESQSLVWFSGAAALPTNIYQSGNARYGYFLDLASQGSAAAAGTASLTLNTAGYSSLTLSYYVYALSTVDGDGPAGGNSTINQDAFITAISGGPVFENYSFANFPGDSQNYPGMQGPPTPGQPGQTGASAVNVLPIDNNNDAIYQFSYTFAPTGNLTTINFTGQTNQGLGDESFGLDNVQVSGVASTVSAVPEPATWAMMILGMGAIGFAMRRRQKVTTRVSYAI